MGRQGDGREVAASGRCGKSFGNRSHGETFGGTFRSRRHCDRSHQAVRDQDDPSSLPIQTCFTDSAETLRVNANHAQATVVGALGGLLFGFDTAVISGTTHALTLLYGLTDWTLGVTVTMALVGTIIGAMSAGIPGQRWGGRETLR